MKSLTGLRQGRAGPGVITSVPPSFIYGLLPRKSWWWSAARPHISPGVNRSSPPTVPVRSCSVKIDDELKNELWWAVLFSLIWGPKKRWPKLLLGVYKLWTHIQGNEHASMEKTRRVLTEKRHTGIIVDNLVAQEIRAWRNLGVALRLLFTRASPLFLGGRCLCEQRNNLISSSAFIFVRTWLAAEAEQRCTSRSSAPRFHCPLNVALDHISTLGNQRSRPEYYTFILGQQTEAEMHLLCLSTSAESRELKNRNSEECFDPVKTMCWT